MFNTAFETPFRALFNAAARVVYLLRDEFSTPEVAPITSPRTCEPGPGSMTIVDSTSKISIVADNLVISAGISSSVDPRFYITPLVARLPGTALVCRLKPTVVAGTEMALGFSTINSVWDGSEISYYMYGGILYVWGSGGNQHLNVPLTNIYYQFAIILRSVGAFLLIKNGAFASYTLVWVDHRSTHTNLYTGLNNYSKSIDVDYVRVAQLPSPWNTDVGLATYYDATPSAGDIATSEANSMQYVEWTPAAGETFEISIRRTDDNNRWIVRCNQVGSTIKIIERNASVETERSSAAQTWTVGTKYGIDVAAYSTTIITYIARSSKNLYQSASFNASATSYKIDGGATLENWEIYPRSISGAALAALEAI